MVVRAREEAGQEPPTRLVLQQVRQTYQCIRNLLTSVNQSHRNMKLCLIQLPFVVLISKSPYLRQRVLVQTALSKHLKRRLSVDVPRAVQIPRAKYLIVVLLLGFGQRPRHPRRGRLLVILLDSLLKRSAQTTRITGKLRHPT